MTLNKEIKPTHTSVFIKLFFIYWYLKKKNKKTKTSFTNVLKEMFCLCFFLLFSFLFKDWVILSKRYFQSSGYIPQGLKFLSDVN